jgi:hypothetical protein
MVFKSQSPQVTINTLSTVGTSPIMEVNHFSCLIME